MQLSNIFVSFVVFLVFNFGKRIAQTIIDNVQNWENACDAANGGQQCNPIAVNASSALLAAADPCAQQDAGDIMVNVAKSLGNNTAMITAAQIFVQQPRNSPDSNNTGPIPDGVQLSSLVSSPGTPANSTGSNSTSSAGSSSASASNSTTSSSPSISPSNLSSNQRRRKIKENSNFGSMR